MPAGLKDVAERANVSIKTVSNVVTGRVPVRPETRQRVEEAIRALDYRPNLSARNLRGGRTGLVALALPELTQPYFAEIADRIIAAATDRGWTVLIDQTDGDPERELVALRGVRERIVDGVIISPLALGHEDLQAVSTRVPVISLGERVHAGAMDHIGIDNVGAARDATAHLLAGGRRRVAAIGTQVLPIAGTARPRLDGFRQALTGAGVDPHPGLECPTKLWERSDGALAVQRLLAAGVSFDAIFCFSDLLAIGALSALHRAGVRVPDDVAVIGIDDIREGRYATPPLTTVWPDKDAIARTSVELLAERLAAGPDDPEPGREVTVGHRVLVRESA